MMKLKSEEVELKGQWNFNGTDIEQDAVCDRIDWLIEHTLNEIAVHEDGWDILYQDKGDKRFWELMHPQSHMHGGGPPLLRVITNQEAMAKYKVKAL